MLRPFDSIFATQAAAFEVTGPLDDAVLRLNAVTRSSAWLAWLEASPDCLMGTVSRDTVVVWWYRGPRTPLPAIFRGVFALNGNKAVLNGQFQYGTRDRVLLVGAVAILLLFLSASVAGLVSAFLAVAPVRDRIAASVFLGALTVATASVLRAIQPLRQDDIIKVSQTIQRALAQEPPNDGLQRPGENSGR